MNNDLLHDGLIAEEHTPMEVDCNELMNNDINHEIKKEPVSVNSEHHQDSLKILQEFVKEKLHRTVLSFADFKKLILLRQTGKWSGLVSSMENVRLLNNFCNFVVAMGYYKR